MRAELVRSGGSHALLCSCKGPDSSCTGLAHRLGMFSGESVYGEQHCGITLHTCQQACHGALQARISCSECCSAMLSRSFPVHYMKTSMDR